VGSARNFRGGVAVLGGLLFAKNCRFKQTKTGFLVSKYSKRITLAEAVEQALSPINFKRKHNLLVSEVNFAKLKEKNIRF